MLSPVHWLWVALAGIAVVAVWMWKQARVNGQKLQIESDLRVVHDAHTDALVRARRQSKLVTAAVERDYEETVARLNRRREKIDKAAVEGGPALEELWANVMKRRYAKKADQ